MLKCFILVVFFVQDIIVSAQIPVSKEPRHHNVFENAFVRVLDVHVSPGDTTRFHKHETPSVFIVLTHVKTGSEVIMEEMHATALSKDAAISFEGFYTKPRIHRVWNEDTAEFHVMDIELLNKNPGNISPPVLQKDLKLLFDEKPVRGYRLTLREASTIQLPAHGSFLIAGLTDDLQAVSVNKKSFNKKGDFLFIKAGDFVKFTNDGQQSYSFAILELK